MTRFFFTKHRLRGIGFSLSPDGSFMEDSMVKLSSIDPSLFRSFRIPTLSSVQEYSISGRHGGDRWNTIQTPIMHFDSVHISLSLSYGETHGYDYFLPYKEDFL